MAIIDLTNVWKRWLLPNNRWNYTSGVRRQMMWWGILCFMLLAIVAAYAYVADQWHSMICRHRLRAIGVALQCYHIRYGVYPPACVCDQNGNPVNSWRALAAPYGIWDNFPSGFNYAKPWNLSKNSELLSRNITRWQFQCPSAHNHEPAITDYVAVVGPNTMWPGRESAKRAGDGSDDDKILVIEVINSDILWMEPRDLTLEQALDAIQPEKGIGIGSHHRDGIHYVTVGGEVRTLDPDIDRESLRKLLVRDSAEVLSK